METSDEKAKRLKNEALEAQKQKIKDESERDKAIVKKGIDKIYKIANIKNPLDE